MITLWQAIAIGLICGVWKTCFCYSVGGFNVNTVIFNAVFVGLIMGDMYSAMTIGAAIQLIYLGNVQAGGNQPADPCLATYIAVPIAIATGLEPGAAVALAVPVGLLGSQITNLTYIVNGFFVERADTAATSGDARAVNLWGVYIPFVVRILMLAIPVTIVIFLGSSALSGVMDGIPVWLSNGLSAMGSCLPAVGFAIITNLIAKPKYVVLFFAGFFLVQYTGVGTMPLLLLGVFISYLFVVFNKDASGRKSADDDDYDDDDDEEEEERPAGAQMLSSIDLLKAWTRWMVWCDVGHSFVRMMAPGFCKAVSPALGKFYPKGKDDPHYCEALERQFSFYNTEGHIGGGVILGLTLAMEEAKSKNYEAMPGEMIVNVKTSLMGPLAGIGDTVVWATLMYLLIGLFMPLAQAGNAMGGIGPVACLTLICFALGYFLARKSYQLGYSFVENMMESSVISVVIMTASVLGLFMMGGLASTYVTVSTPIMWTVSGTTTQLQAIFDSIVPGILPLVTVLGVWGFLRVRRNYFLAAILVAGISLVLGCLGIII